MDIIRNQYDQIAKFYELFHAGTDMEAFKKEFIALHGEFLDRLPPGAAVCDCACGPGHQAIALRERGFNVFASDISEGMLELARANAAKANVSFPIKRAAWRELPREHRGEFDAVFCWGNSISSSLSAGDLKSNIKAIAQTIKPGGLLFIDTRNWDKIVNNGQKYYFYGLLEHEGSRYVSMNVMPGNRFNRKCSLDMLFINTAKNEMNVFKLDYMPFEYSSFIRILGSTGFQLLKSNYRESNDYYYLVLEKNRP